MIAGKEHHHSIDYNLLSKGLTADPSGAGVSRDTRDRLPKPKPEALKAPYRDLQQYLGRAHHALQFAPRNLSRSLADERTSQVDLLDRRPKQWQGNKQQPQRHQSGSELLSSQKLQPDAHHKKQGWRHAHHESLHELLPDEDSSVARGRRNRSSNNELSALGGSIHFSHLHSTMNNKDRAAEGKSAQKTQFMKKLFEKTLLRRTADVNVANFLVSSTGPRKKFLQNDKSNSGEPRKVLKGTKIFLQDERKDLRRGLDSTEYLERDGKSNSELTDKVRKLFNRTLLKTKPQEMKTSIIHRSFQNPSSGGIAPPWNPQALSTKANQRSAQLSAIPGLMKNTALSSLGSAGKKGIIKNFKSEGLEDIDPRSRSRKQQKRKSKESKRKESTSKPSTKTGSKQSLSSRSIKQRRTSKPKSRLVTPPPARKLAHVHNQPMILGNEGGELDKPAAAKINNPSSGKKKTLQYEDKITPFRSSKNLSPGSHQKERRAVHSSSHKKSRTGSSRSPKNKLAKFYNRLCELVDSLDHNYNQENIKAISKMFLDYARLVEEIDADYPNKPRSAEENSLRNKLLNFFAFFTKMNSQAYNHSKEIISGALGVVEEFVLREHGLLKEYVPEYFEDKKQQSLSLEQAVAMLVNFSDKMVEVNNSLSAYIKSSLIENNIHSKHETHDYERYPKTIHGTSVISKSEREFEEHTKLDKAASKHPHKDGDYRLVETRFQPQAKPHDHGSPRILDYRDPILLRKEPEKPELSDPRDHDFDDLEVMESESDQADIEDTPVGKLRREFQLVESKDSQDGGLIKSKDDSNFQMNHDPKQTLSIETQKYALGVKSQAKQTAVQPIGLGLVREPPVLLEKIYSLKKDSDFEYSETSKKKPLGAQSGALSSSGHSTNQKSELQFNLFSNTLQGSSYQRKDDGEQSGSSKGLSPEGPKQSRLVPELKLRLGPIQTDGDERMYYSGKEEDRTNPWVQHI